MDLDKDVSLSVCLSIFMFHYEKYELPPPSYTWPRQSATSAIILLTYLLHAAELFLRNKSRNSPAFHGTRRFIISFTNARQLSLSWASSIQSILSHPTSWRSILILSSHLRLVLPKWCLSLRLPHQNPVHVSPFPHTHYMSRPSHYSRFYHPNNIGWTVQIIKLLIM